MTSAAINIDLDKLLDIVLKGVRRASVFMGLGINVALDEKHIKSIAKIQLGFVEKRLAQMDIRLEVSDSALAELAETGFDPVYGARPLKRAIQAQIENLLAKEILEGRFAAKDTVKVDYKGGKFVFSKS